MSQKAVIITRQELVSPKKEHSKCYLILAYYYLTSIENPVLERECHKDFFEGKDVKARIYVSEQGINGTLSAPVEDAYAYMQWLVSREEFSGVIFKAHEWDCHVFGRLAVKVRKELVAYGDKIELDEERQHLSPREWKEMLETEEDKVVLDIRNDYEWEVGHFKGAEKPDCLTFREFKEYARKLKSRIPTKDTKVMMYCTGGIRCEFFSSLLKQDGIENIYQLEGGVINYGVEEDSAHWRGKLYVFDDRLQVPISDEKTEITGTCHHCKIASDVYYNCASMDCNELFLCCPECLEKHQGCCKTSCMSDSRLRPFSLVHTPFRRRHMYAKTKD